MIFNLLGIPSTESAQQDYEDKICTMESQINDLTLMLKETLNEVDSIKALNPWVNKDTRQAMYTYMKNSS